MEMHEKADAEFFSRYCGLPESEKLDVVRTLLEMGLGCCSTSDPEFQTFLKLIRHFDSWSIQPNLVGGSQ